MAAAPRAAPLTVCLQTVAGQWIPVGAASQAMAGSNQPCGDCRQSPAGQRIVSEPRRLSASLAIGFEPMAPQWLDRRASSWSCRRGGWVCSCRPATTLVSRDESLTRFVQQSRADTEKAPRIRLYEQVCAPSAGSTLAGSPFFGCWRDEGCEAPFIASGRRRDLGFGLARRIYKGCDEHRSKDQDHRRRGGGVDVKA